MKISRTITIEEISGAWVVSVDGEDSKCYSQLPITKDDKRLVKDLLKILELQNSFDVRELAL